MFRQPGSTIFSTCGGSGREWKSWTRRYNAVLWLIISTKSQYSIYTKNERSILIFVRNRRRVICSVFVSSLSLHKFEPLWVHTSFYVFFFILDVYSLLSVELPERNLTNNESFAKCTNVL